LAVENKYIDANPILQAINIVCLGLFIIFFWKMGPNRYIAPMTFGLSLLLFLQLQIILMYENGQRDPFLLLLSFFLLLYYNFRLLTLLVDPSSVVLPRFQTEAAGLDYSLIHIHLGIWAIFFGLAAVKTRRDTQVPDPKPNLIAFSLYLFCLFVFLLLDVYGYMYAKIFLPETTDRLLRFMLLFLDYQIVLLFIIVFIFIYAGRLSKTFLSITIFLIFLFVLERTFSGSRQAILIIMIMFLLAGLAAHGTIRIYKPLIYSVPLIGTAAFILFKYATQARVIMTHLAVMGWGNWDFQTFAGRIGKYDPLSTGIIGVFRPVFQRLGQLDRAADMIVNGSIYGKLITFTNYAKSIVDGLTPGFDIFNMPRVATLVRNLYYGNPIDYRPTGYHSDQMTVFGEYYILFGPVISLVIIFIICIFFKIIYNSMRFSDEYIQGVVRAFILLNFVGWLESYGFDWQFVRLIYTAIPLVVLVTIYWISGRDGPGTRLAHS